MWIEGWSSVVTVIFNRVEARESLVDRRLPNSPLYQCDYRRGSREPCGSKASPCTAVCMALPSRLARALWIEGRILGYGLPDWSSRGSREPCGSKVNLDAVPAGRYQSRLARALWIEIIVIPGRNIASMSRLARALWIEIHPNRWSG